MSAKCVLLVALLAAAVSAEMNDEAPVYDDDVTQADADRDIAAIENQAEAAVHLVEAPSAIENEILSTLVAAPPSAKAKAGFAASPMGRVVTLLKALTTKIGEEGSNEQAAYDKYSCWVENQLKTKAGAISAAKKLISELADKIIKLKAQIATSEVEVKQGTKDIAENKQSTKAAEAMRTKENTDFANSKLESQLNIAALIKGIATLDGTGTFLSVNTRGSKKVKEAALLNAAVDLHEVILSRQIQTRLSASEANELKRFVQNPQEFASNGLIAAQTGNNPAGDYAPASGQIQGILKGQSDALTADLKEDEKQEASSLSDHNALLGTKSSELATLVAGLQADNKALASDQKALADAQVLRDVTADQQESDEEFFALTKKAAANKATEWSTRVRLRTEELSGMTGAIGILEGGSNTLNKASTTFVQLKAASNHEQNHHIEMLTQMQKLAVKHQSAYLQRCVTLLKNGGHFDDVMESIDSKMKLLRGEEQNDIEHRDRCQEKQNDNRNDLADANSGVANAGSALARMGNENTDLGTSLGAKKAEIKATKTSMANAKALRLKENEDFKEAAEMDSQAAALVKKAGASLVAYSLVQSVSWATPKYTKDPKKAPKTEFASANAHKSETGNVVAILDMIVEDFEKEIKEGKADEATAQADYDKQTNALKKSLDAQIQAKVSMEKEISDLKKSMTRTTKVQNEEKSDKAAALLVKAAVKADCDWVKTGFASRRTKRKTEMDGLVDAKDFLAGVASGGAVLAPR